MGERSPNPSSGGRPRIYDACVHTKPSSINLEEAK